MTAIIMRGERKQGHGSPSTNHQSLIPRNFELPTSGLQQVLLVHLTNVEALHRVA